MVINIEIHAQKRKLPYNNIFINRAGFTLIEVLVSLVLVAIILTTFFGFFGQTLLTSDKNEDKLVAYNLATKTLKIIEEKYNNQSIPTTLSCGNFPSELSSALQPSSCFFKQNNKPYYPEITLTKDKDFPNLTIVHVKIFNTDNTNRKLLSETFGYVRQAM